jgi:class 3 adenylate cyclase/tetratricopeptide (TPR) repeat protein/ribosomal protein L40E
MRRLKKAIAMLVDSPVCMQCNAAVPADARFCPQCGSRIGGLAPASAPAARPEAAASPPAERRQVAILFADLTGYTRLSSTLDAEEVHRLLSRYFELVDGVIGHFGGTIDKHIGDAVMAVFGAPVAHGNDAERALRAAVQIHAAMTSLTREFGRPLAAHIGIASGEVVAADTGSAAHRNYTMTGDAVNLAARLVELAHAGETAISDDIYRTHAHLIDADAQGTVPIRGLGREVPVWKLRALRAPGSVHERLVGRAVELERFCRVLSGATAGKTGTTVLVCADPGLGKTRLAEEFLAAAADRGMGCHSAEVLDFGAAQGRDAIHRIYCSVLGLGADAAVTDRRDALDSAIADGRVDGADEPFAVDLLVIPQSPHSRYEAMDNAARTEGKLRALAAAVERASVRRTLVLLIEDVHWASPWVMACLRDLASRAQRMPCILVLTSRREGQALTQRWPVPEVIRIDLEPLGNSEALELARTFLTANPDVAVRCVERAQGNPLFLTQLLRSGADGATIPGTIQSVVLARLDGLPPLDKAALQAASVIGQRYDLDVLRHLLQDPGYDGATLQERDLVRREPGDGTHWMFGHALIRDGAYASLLHSARRTLHLRAADWYAGRDATLHAEHLDRANDPRAALAYLRAAEAEVAALRVESALRLLRRGAELDAPAAVRHALAALEGEMCRDVGDVITAIKAFERALPLAADDAQRCAAWIGVAEGHRVTGTSARAFAALDRAQELAGRGGLDRELSRIHYVRGNLHFAQGNGPACRAEHERALEFAQRAGDAECEAQALSGLGDAHYAHGRMRSAHAAFSRCVAICERAGLSRFSIMNDAMLAIIDTWQGSSEPALQRLARNGALARELRHRLAESMNEQVAGWMLVTLGSYDKALPHLEKGLALCREIGARRYEMMCLIHLARAYWERGERQRARANLRDSWAMSEESGHGFIGPAVQGAMALMADSDDERRDALAKGEALLREGSLGHCHLWFYRDAIESSLNSGAWAEAERYANALEAFTRDEPLLWTDYQIAIARAFAAQGRGKGSRAALLACREMAVELREAVYLPVLDAALARSAGADLGL